MSLRLWTLIVCVAAGAVASAGPVSVRTWVTPKPGQTPFDPDLAGQPTRTFDVNGGEPFTLGVFTPSDAWISPAPGGDRSESKYESRQYLFNYHAAVTDLASGQKAELTLDGEARADWMERYDGMVLPGTLAVGFAADDEWTTVGSNRYRLTAVERAEGDRVTSSVRLETLPAEVPEPGTLALGVGGLVVAAGVWRRKQRRAALTSDHLPQ